jgi:hypothetical protein
VALAAAAIGAALALAPSSAGAFSITYPSGPDPAVREWPVWPEQVSCGGLSFDPVAAFGGETGAEEGPGAPEQALRALIEERPPGMPTRYYRVMAADATRVEFAQGRLAQGPFRIAFELSGGQWRPSGFPGYCVPRSVRPGEEAINWKIAGDGRLRPAARRIRVSLRRPGGCDGGRSLDAAARPEFRQSGRRLAMTIWVEALSPGVHTCKGLREPPLQVTLPGPLGRRTLFDGATYPPHRRR